MSAGDGPMIEAVGVRCDVGFVPETAHNDALEKAGGNPPAYAGLFISNDPENSANLMITINFVGMGIVWASLDQHKLETIADLMVGASPAPAGETIQ